MEYWEQLLWPSYLPKMGDLVQIPTTQVVWFIAGKALGALVHQPER